jgi:ligand-binding sensor domain-containing protein/AraC-like DNA-binding protein
MENDVKSNESKNSQRYHLRNLMKGDKGGLYFFVITFFCFFFLQTFHLFPLDPDQDISDYALVKWTTRDGLPSNMILAVTQCQQGYIWMASYEGLIRFDGVKFTIFNKINTPEFKSDIILTILESKNGDLWIGTSDGLLKLSNGKFSLYTTGDGLPDTLIRALCEDKNGDLWIGTARGGVTRLKDGIFRTYSVTDGLSDNSVQAICQDHEGNIWIGTRNGGLNRFKDDVFSVYTMKDGLTSNFVFSLYVDPQGIVRIGTGGGGINVIKNGKIFKFPPPGSNEQKLEKQFIHGLCEDRQGNLWIGTKGSGLFRWRDNVLSNDSLKSSMGINLIRGIYEDREGNLWVGTDDNGILCFKDRQFDKYTKRNGLSDNVALSVLDDGRGNIWIGTFSGGLNRLRNGTIKHYTLEHGLPYNTIGAMCMGHDGALWIGTNNGSLCRYDYQTDKIITYTGENRLKRNHYPICSLYEDSKKNLWIGSDGGGLTCFKNGQFYHFNVKNKICPDNRVMAILEDRKGNLWIGNFGGGLNLLKDDKILVYSVDDGLPGNHIDCLYEDQQGNLWIGTYGQGLGLLKDERFYTLTSRHGLPSDFILTIIEDKNHNLWIGSQIGIFKVVIDDLINCAKGQTTHFHSVLFPEIDGLENAYCNSSFPGSPGTADGKLLFATVSGLVVVDPVNIKYNPSVPQVIIEDVKVDGQLLDMEKKEKSGKHIPISISPGKKRFEFYYTAFHFAAPKKLKFKYQLEGFDEEWRDVGTPAERVAYYTNLSPGRYRFRVIACSNDGTWNKTGASFSFDLKPFFYQTYWFYGLCTIGFILLGLVLHLLRARQIIIREKKKYEKVRLSPEYAEKYMKKLLHLMESEKPFLNSDICLHGLSERLNIPDHYLSQVINTRLNQNFYDFINQYRVEEAKRILANSKNHLTILEVAFEVGFNSKSAFNRVFKKYVKMTPSDFKKEKNDFTIPARDILDAAS